MEEQRVELFVRQHLLAATQQRTLAGMLALSGMAAESMVRDAGWTMMDIGKRIEPELPKLFAAFDRAPDAELAEPIALLRDLVREGSLSAGALGRRHGVSQPAAWRRIKRLEEAGDAMVDKGWNEPHLAGEWRKAKEAKP